MKEKICFWAPILSGCLVAACLVYCIFWWHPHPMTWKDPDCSFICWFYCATLKIQWALAGFLVSALSCLGGLVHARQKRLALWCNLIAGLLLFPTGILNLTAFGILQKRHG